MRLRDFVGVMHADGGLLVTAVLMERNQLWYLDVCRTMSPVGHQCLYTPMEKPNILNASLLEKYRSLHSLTFLPRSVSGKSDISNWPAKVCNQLWVNVFHCLVNHFRQSQPLWWSFSCPIQLQYNQINQSNGSIIRTAPYGIPNLIKSAIARWYTRSRTLSNLGTWS